MQFDPNERKMMNPYLNAGISGLGGLLGQGGPRRVPIRPQQPWQHPIQSPQHGFNQFGEQITGFGETLGGYGEQLGGFGETLGGLGEQIAW